MLVASFNAMVAHYGVIHLPVASGLSLSALRGIQHATHYPTLLLPCDLPLLTPTLIDQYCQQMSSVDASLAIGTVDYAHIQDVLPTLKKNLSTGRAFALLCRLIFATHRGGNAGDQVLAEDQAAQQLSHKTGVRIAIENLAMPELAIDIDSVMDYQIVQEYIGEQ